MFYLAEADMIRNRIRWNMGRLTEEEQDYCRTEARKLDAMGLTDEDGSEISYDAWLDEVSSYVVALQDSRRAALCAEMGEM